MDGPLYNRTMGQFSRTHHAKRIARITALLCWLNFRAGLTQDMRKFARSQKWKGIMLDALNNELKALERFEQKAGAA